MSKSNSRKQKKRSGHPQDTADSNNQGKPIVKSGVSNDVTDESFSEVTSSNKNCETDWSVRVRIIVSVLVLLHLLAVFSAPFAMPEPSSELSVGIDQITGPYTSALYMRHGYRFFAPDPGPSHLLRYEVVSSDGESIVEGRFPDKSVHIPRLMYHRFFMISEHFWGLGVLSESTDNQSQIDDLNRAVNYLRENGFVDQADWLASSIPATPDEDLEEERIATEIRQLENDGKFYAAKRIQRNFERGKKGLASAKRHRKIWLEGIAKYLKRKHNGAVVRIWIQEHLIPDYDHILDGGTLDDLETYGPRQLVYSDEEVVQ